MKVTFKDVGQGDSVIIEWIENEVEKVGIIDCCKKGRLNPVVRHIKDKGYEELEFVVLSHPHRDHYSGMPDLFNYCFENQIRVKFFFHTMNHIGSDYFKFFEVDNTSLGELDNVLIAAKRLIEKELLEERYPTYGDSENLGEIGYIKFLAPHKSEITECLRLMNFEHEKKKRSKAANFLSTVIKLRIKDQVILFTADAEREVFVRIREKHFDLLHDKQLLLCQAPHHGSYRNYEDDFWKNLNFSPNTPVVTSAGQHRKYRHPSYETVKAFHDNGYSIHSTSIINGMKQFVEELQAIDDILDCFSDVAEEYYTSGDKVFEF